MKAILAAFGGSDGKTALIGVQATAGVLVFLGLAVWSFARGTAAFDMGAFSVAFAGVIGASAAAIAGHAWGAAKADAIPSAPPVPPAPPASGP